ncbi:unnamed protein product [Lepeophtheirus salmonis]|uniref:(salmon louse) hypothetical protein n=1 Tax=Lepeophtheirus salmonis TaxID=72036 RepID=A0A7R8H1M4_LEPSM|nr:unnamed protein product [Lepeophtheirus salmonis]CAF2796622.1 unnamed protein product [Lepeophtheirus salmonis]
MSDDILEQVVDDIKDSPSSTCRTIKLKKVSYLPLTEDNIETHRRVQCDKRIPRYQLHLDRIGSICTDGTPAILGNRSGLFQQKLFPRPEKDIGDLCEDFEDNSWSCSELSPVSVILENCFVDWARKERELGNFPTLEETVTEDAFVYPDFVSKIVQHLQLLCTSFDDYFSCGELQPCDNGIWHPFKQNMDDLDDDSDIKEDLID